MNIVMMGVQGSGKGTQSKLLSKHLKVPHISVGDLFRDNIARGTELGQKAKAFTDKGELVPDPIVIDMVRDRLEQGDASEGFILDGFPRSGVQLAAMEYFRPADCAILLHLDDEEAVRRLAGRSECRHCGIIYGANRQPKKEGVCDVCGRELASRRDDADVEAVRRRLLLYHREIDVMVAYYEWKGILQRVDGNGSVSQVHDNVVRVISAGRRGQGNSANSRKP